jgi:hypothetical protein
VIGDRGVERELVIILRDDISGTTARYELAYQGAEIVAEGFEDEPEAAYRQAIEDLRHGLALAFCTGRMVPVCDGVDDEEAAKRAIASFAPEELTITDEDIRRAHDKEIEGHVRAATYAERMIELIESQKAHEHENLTTGEAIERFEEGAEQMRKIVGDDQE